MGCDAYHPLLTDFPPLHAKYPDNVTKTLALSSVSFCHRSNLRVCAHKEGGGKKKKQKKKKVFSMKSFLCSTIYQNSANIEPQYLFSCISFYVLSAKIFCPIKKQNKKTHLKVDFFFCFQGKGLRRPLTFLCTGIY